MGKLNDGDEIYAVVAEGHGISDNREIHRAKVKKEGEDSSQFYIESKRDGCVYGSFNESEEGTTWAKNDLGKLV